MLAWHVGLSITLPQHIGAHFAASTAAPWIAGGFASQRPDAPALHCVSARFWQRLMARNWIEVGDGAEGGGQVLTSSPFTDIDEGRRQIQSCT